VAFGERAAQLAGGRDPAVLDALAAAYAEVGRFPDALATARQALGVAAAQNRSPLVDELRREVLSYESGKAVRGR
jgi:hypothetical protein